MIFLSIIIISILCSAYGNEDDIIEDSHPQQIHLSLGRNLNEIVVTWSTFYEYDETYVFYGDDANNLHHLREGNATKFVDGGDLKRTQFIHRVFLSNLTSLTRYYYKCGSKDVWSEVFDFKMVSNETNWSPRMLVYGDLGLENGVSIPFIKNEVDKGNADLIFHNGDFAYNMATDNGKVGDRFMNKIQPIAAKMIYMSSTGNHEHAYNFSHYVNRFSTYDMTSISGRKADFYYAFYVGPAFMVVLNTEVYYPWNFNKNDQKMQKDWLKYVLHIANEPANRANHPWIIVFAHKPLYCTNNHTEYDDCTYWASLFRNEFEDLLYNYGVDLVIVAHEHSFERTFPVYKSQARNNLSKPPYTNPKAPVHIIIGNAGNSEELDTWDDTEPWSAYRLREYGYGMMQIVNSSHLVFQHKNSGKFAGQVTDSITLIQENHGPFGKFN